MTGIVSVYSTFGSDEEALRVGRMLVEERLAACVNVLGSCRSIYRWQGKIEEAQEIAAVFKTTSGQAQQLIERLTELHPHDVPAAVVWPIAEANPHYAQWVAEETGREL